MKGKKGLVLLLICICALVAVYFVVKAIPDKDNDTTSETTTKVKPNIPIVTHDYADIAKIRIVNQYGDETYFRSDEGTWIAERDKTAYINDTILNRMAVYGSEISGIAKVQESKDNLAMYGLEEPSQSITLSYSDGTEARFYIGLRNQVTQEYYFMADETEGVYTVHSTLPGYFNFSFNDVIMYEDIMTPADISDIAEMQIEYESINKWHLLRYDAGSKYDVSGVRSWFIMDVFDHETAIDTSKLEAIKNCFMEFTLEFCEIYSATEEQLKEYGLADGATKGSAYYLYEETASDNVTKTEKTVKIWLGNKTEDGLYYYVRPDGRNGVYKMLAENIDELLSYKAEDLLQKYISVINISTIDSYSVKMGDISFAANVTSFVDENDITSYTHHHNGKALDKDGASGFYAALIGVYAEKGYAVKEEPSGEPVLTLTFNRNTEILPFYEVAFYEYSVSYYKVAVNGEISYLVNARDFKSLKETITTFVTDIPYAE